ncbi:hypothetical protein [Dolichospermum circinale]|uniref:hypothetical protein n=1 Tax=Dolichospermum circinale TaxID=109265 RepID=UPI0004294FE1|nr:hypothetical protein [Dolichospermum circinale]MDB9476589.1 hypothetical protein [Dolichospermum circinale CS-537/11]MDB9478144.1 hypothetical protein [Dolichospermum circinale CS-537/03]
MLNYISNHISKIITSSQLKFPLTGLIISVGVLGIVYSSQQHQKLLSPATLSTSNYISHNHQNEINSGYSVRSQLGEIKQEKIEQPQISNSANSYQLSPDKLTKNTTKLSTNTIKSGRKEKLQFPEEDGIYLYGKSEEGYIVFQKRQNQIIGALYFPQSEFTCFQGSLAKSGKLAMMVRTLPGEVGKIEVATTSKIPKINENELTTYPYSVTLEDYHQLSSVSSNDRKILQICQQGSDGFR